MVVAFICEMLVIFNGERKRPGSRSGKDLVREGRLDAFCRRLRREVRNHVAVRVPWSHLCCEALWPFPAEPGAYFCSFWNGKTFCDSLSSPPPLLPASLASSPPHRVPGANCPDSLGFVCLHFRGKAAYICVLRAKSLFLLIPACPLEMFVS